MPAASSFGHSESAWSTVMFDCADMSGSLKPSRYGPACFACASAPVLALALPQIIGTKPGPLTPLWVVDQV